MQRVFCRRHGDEGAKSKLAVLQVWVCAGEWAEAGMGRSGAGVDDGEACGVAGEERVKMSSRSEGSVAEESGNGIRGGIDIRSVDMVVRGRSASCTGSKKDLTDRTVRSEQVTKVCVSCSNSILACSY